MADIIRSYVIRSGYSGSAMAWEATLHGEIPEYHPLVKLADDTGLARDTLLKWLQGRTKKLRWDDVDALFCAMDMPLAWMSDELRVHYFEGKNPPPRTLLPEGIENPGWCQRFGCEEWFDKTGKQAKRKFCSRSCQEAAATHRRGVHVDKRRTCRNGHERTPENTERFKAKNMASGWGERCIVCRRDAVRRSRAAKLVTA